MSTLCTHYCFVCKTGIKQYYASLDRHAIQTSLSRWIQDPRILQLIWQYCDRVEDRYGAYRHHTGHPQRGPLSVVIGTLYLVDLDALGAKKQVRCLCYMDDVIFFCKNRMTLRHVVKNLYGVLERLQLKLASAKTYIGKVTKGFDFLGYRMGDGAPSTVSVAQTSIQRVHQRVQRLYEQRASSARVAAYVTHWHRWVTCGLGSLQVVWPYFLNNPDDSQVSGLNAQALCELYMV